MKPIHIDLRNLSQEHLAQCKPALGCCSYDGPCVIGTLIQPDRRERLGNSDVGFMVRFKHFTTVEGQLGDLIEIQEAFDKDDWLKVERIAAKYIGQGIEAGTVETQSRLDPERDESPVAQPCLQGDEL